MGNKVLFSYELSDSLSVQVVHGDLTEERVEAIVNAADEQLRHGGGVAGAIVRRGGYEIQRESDLWVREHGPLPTGQAVLTGAGNLPAQYVIHTVGPIWRGQGDEPELLQEAVQSALRVASSQGLRSVSMPAISSGIFGFPKPLAAQVSWEAVLAYLSTHPESSLEVVRFCNIDAYTAGLFRHEGERRLNEELKL